uniref:U5 small nuclear ribonucleoprotein TSSC4 n=1 Tax=Pogona vitticeps TaxID=103695 RepID=A0A6J0TAB8_9SAUR
MGDKSTGEPFLGIEVAGATDYEGVLPSDTVSLSDSDSEDLTFADDIEAGTVSPEEPLSLDNRGKRSDENGDFLHSDRKSPVQPFHLKGMSSSFSQRSQSIFDCLEGAAKRTVPSMAEDNVIDGRFKRPLPPPNISNKMSIESLGRQNKPHPSLKGPPSVPDYVTHPERWTKYSLDDVSESSEKTNRSIAMEFLEGLKKSKEEQTSSCPERYTPSFNQDASSSGASRIVFTKPTKTSLYRSERKRPHAQEDEENKLIDTDQELKGKSPKKPSTQDDGGNPSDSDAKELEDWKQLNLEEPNIQNRVDTDSSEASEEKGMGAEGFHGSKKRNRKHFRPKTSHDEDEEES